MVPNMIYEIHQLCSYMIGPRDRAGEKPVNVCEVSRMH